jgi:hypothetical protein
LKLSFSSLERFAIKNKNGLKGKKIPRIGSITGVAGIVPGYQKQTSFQG